MKRFAVLMVLAILFLAGCAIAKYGVMTEKTDDFTVTTNFVNDPPVTGENDLIISIKDQTGKAVTDAAVRVDYFMSEKRISARAYVAMPKHGSIVNGEVKDAVYNAKLNFSMSGPWHIEVLVMRDGKEQTAKFFTMVK